jgi:hypothetical protein
LVLVVLVGILGNSTLHSLESNLVKGGNNQLESDFSPELINSRAVHRTKKFTIQVVIPFQEALAENLNGIVALHQHVRLPGELEEAAHHVQPGFNQRKLIFVETGVKSIFPNLY